MIKSLHGLGGITETLSATKEEVLPLTGRFDYPQCPCMPEEEDELSCPARIKRHSLIFIVLGFDSLIVFR